MNGSGSRNTHANERQPQGTAISLQTYMHTEGVGGERGRGGGEEAQMHGDMKRGRRGKDEAKAKGGECNSGKNTEEDWRGKSRVML